MVDTSLLFKGGLIFFRLKDKCEVFHFEHFIGGFFNKGKLLLKDDSLKGDLLHLCDRNSVCFFKRNRISSVYPVLLHHPYPVKDD